MVQSRKELDDRITNQLSEIRFYLKLPDNSALDIAGNCRSLIMSAHEHYREQVIILIDEYDKPILDNISDKAIASEVRKRA